MITMKGKVIITIVVLMAAGFGVWRWWDKIAPKPQPAVPSLNVKEVNQKIEDLTKQAAADVMGKLLAGTNSANLVDSKGIPAITTVSAYDKATKNGKVLVRFPINVWPGWAPIIVANNGMEANDESIFYKKYGFYVELSLVDDPIRARDLFASGHTHILWGTLDMFALFAPSLCKDSRTVPVIPQQIDWSAGGDGIVARNDIRSINDFRMKNGVRKKVVLAQNSPSHYFLMAMLLNASIDPAELDIRWTADAPSAAKIFVQDESFDAFVGWAPDIYTVADSVPGTRLVVTSGQANNVVADVWAVRNDFYKDNPMIVENLIRGIFEGMDIVRKDPKTAAKYLSVAYDIPVEDCEGMIGSDGGIATGDAHLTNYRENHKFFLDPMNPANFEAIWNKASTIYHSLGAIDSPVSAAKVKEARLLANMAEEYKDVSDLSQRVYTPNTAFKNLEAYEGQILTKSVIIQFEPSHSNINTNYDTSIPDTLRAIGELAAAFGNCYIFIEGNTDASLRDDPRFRPSIDAIRKLSYDRADSVKTALLEKYPSFDPNQFTVRGNGWDNPLPGCTDAKDEEQNKKNRRVEVKVYPLEQ